MDKERLLRLKAVTIEALINSKSIRLAYRPLHIKFYEDNAILLANINSYHHLSIGDLVDIIKEPRWLTGGQHMWTNTSEIFDCFVSAFFEINGRVIGGTQIKDIFCALVRAEKSTRHALHKQVIKTGKQVIRTGQLPTDPLVLFWAEGLKKI